MGKMVTGKVVLIYQSDQSLSAVQNKNGKVIHVTR